MLLAVEGVSLRFGGVKAITDVSFDIRRGEIRAIIGPNGAGKTSMLNVINGFYHPQQGTHHLQGRDARRACALDGGASGHRAHVPERRAVQGHDDARQHHGRPHAEDAPQLLLAAAAPRPGAARRRSRIAVSSRRSSTSWRSQAIRKIPVGKLPYGLQKRVELGRALAMEPELLLLDEPMAGMNLEEKEDMCRFILDVNNQFGTTIALIEHDMGVVMDLSDRVVVLDYGRKIADGRSRRGEAATRRSSPPISASRTRARRWTCSTRCFLDPFVQMAGRPICWCRPSGKVWSPACSMRSIALGFVLIFKASGVFNFAQGIMVVFAALTLVGLHELGVPALLALVARASPSCSCSPSRSSGWCCGRWSTSPTSSCSWRRSASPISSIGFGELVFGGNPKRDDHRRSFSCPSGAIDLQILGGFVSLQKLDIAAAVIASLMVAVLAVFFQKTRIGRALRAVADSHQAALSVGISLNQIWVIVWFAAGIVALVDRHHVGRALGRVVRACRSSR